MLLHLVDGCVDVSFGVVGAAESEVGEPSGIFLAVPAPMLRLDPLSLVGPEV